MNSKRAKKKSFKIPKSLIAHLSRKIEFHIMSEETLSSFRSLSNVSSIKFVSQLNTLKEILCLVMYYENKEVVEFLEGCIGKKEVKGLSLDDEKTDSWVMDVENLLLKVLEEEMEGKSGEDDADLFDVLRELNHLDYLIEECKMELKEGFSKELNDILLLNVNDLRFEIGKHVKLCVVNFVNHETELSNESKFRPLVERLCLCIEKQEENDVVCERKYGKLARRIHLKESFYEILRRLITRSFDFSKREVYEVKRMLEIVENNVKFFRSFSSSALVKEFPKDWNYEIIEIFYSAVYDNMKFTIDHISSKENLSNEEMLLLIDWIERKYSSVLQGYDKFGVQVLKMEILKGKLERQFLESIEAMMFRMCNKMIDGWFNSELEPVQLSSDSPIYTPIPKNLFQILTMSMSEVVSRELRNLSILVFQVVKKIVLHYEKRIEEKINDKEKKFHPFEYIPLINDYVQIGRYLGKIGDELSNTKMFGSKEFEWIPHMKVRFSYKAENLFRRYLNMVSEKLEKKTEKLFTEKWLSLEKSVTAKIIKLVDINEEEVDDLEDRFLMGERFIEYFMAQYVKRLFLSKLKITDLALKVMEVDAGLVKTFRFGKKYVRALKFIRTIIQVTDEDEFIITLGNMLKKFPDVQEYMINEIISKGEISEKILSEKLGIVKYFFKDRQKVKKKTFFSKVKFKQPQLEQKDFDVRERVEFAFEIEEKKRFLRILCSRNSRSVKISKILLPF